MAEMVKSTEREAKNYLGVSNFMCFLCFMRKNNNKWTSIQDKGIVKPVLGGTQKEDQKLFFKADYHLMQVRECSGSVVECLTGD